MSQHNDLNRFIDAQKRDYALALSEIKNGRKQSHWMWYIFPQIHGLGFSETSRFYSIKNMQEAETFLNHPVLGQRLIEICNELLKSQTNDAHKVFGSPDDVKLKSSMTLFSLLPNTNPVFQSVLDKFFNGEKDDKTLQIISEEK
ncbi:MAG TPA: DUF1810 domain-containing protein [Hanamia sp.]|jgi:uncharacterized protein (DUF1810 family)|nr:DUF1810 domain-containing protein [Hanamia sp.]